MYTLTIISFHFWYLVDRFDPLEIDTIVNVNKTNETYTYGTDDKQRVFEFSVHHVNDAPAKKFQPSIGDGRISTWINSKGKEILCEWIFEVENWNHISEKTNCN